MRHLNPPGDAGQNGLFDAEFGTWWTTQLAPEARRRLEQGLEGVMRRSILKRLPAAELGGHFDEAVGRPTKELYAMAGLMLIAEFRDWTIDQAADAWSFDAGVQFALNLPRDRQYLCPRTLDTYRRLLREDEAAQGIFETVTSGLVEELGVQIGRQRLDSTHVLSNMASFGRLKLMAVTTKRFLTQLMRHHREGYEALPEPLRARYTAAESRIFGFGTKNPVPREEAVQTVAEDMVVLIEEFASVEAVSGRSSYKALERVFNEQCEVSARGRLRLRDKALDDNEQSARVLQNPSDEGAGYDGHKGAGYQVQLAQACPEPGQGPGLIVGCLPQSAAESDSAAVACVLEQQERMGTLPGEQLADTGYGSEENVQACAGKGVALVAPVPGRAATAKRAAKPPHAEGPAAPSANEQRRAAQQTAEWKKRYAKRSGIEGLHRALDRTTGLKELRVRGRKAVWTSTYLKVTGWNIRTAAAILKIRARNQAKAEKARIAASKTAEATQNRPQNRPASRRPAHRRHHQLGFPRR